MEYVNFLDVCTDVTKTTMKIPQSLYLKEGKYPIFDQGKEYIGGYTNETNVSSNYPYILFGDHTRILKYINHECFIGADGVKLLKVHNPKFIDKYIYYYLIANPILSQGYSRHYKFLKEIKFKYVDLEKQQKIVDEIDYIYRKIDLCKEQIVNLETIVKSQFIEMFGDCKNHDLIGNVLNICRGASPRPISNFITSDADGVNWIKIGDVDENSLYITSTDEKITRDGALKSRFVKPGDFILSNSMSFGRPYILGINGCVHDGWLILSDYENTFNPLYLYHAIRDDEIQYQFNGKANGATVRNLNSELVRNTSIKIPPIELQNKFASFVQQIDKSKYFGGAYYEIC